MAAEALEKMGEQLGHKVKVETHGSSGVKNKFTKEEIKNAKAIIVAADVNVDLSRFNGKKVLKVGVSEGIHNPKKLIEKALKEINGGKKVDVHASGRTDAGVHALNQKVHFDLVTKITPDKLV